MSEIKEGMKGYGLTVFQGTPFGFAEDSGSAAGIKHGPNFQSRDGVLQRLAEGGECSVRDHVLHELADGGGFF